MVLQAEVAEGVGPRSCNGLRSTTFYTVRVYESSTVNSLAWRVSKRYRDFVQLDRELVATKSRLRRGSREQLPPKGCLGFRHYFDVGDFNQQRRLRLELYLNALVTQVHSLTEDPVLDAFLSSHRLPSFPVPSSVPQSNPHYTIGPENWSIRLAQLQELSRDVRVRFPSEDPSVYAVVDQVVKPLTRQENVSYALLRNPNGLQAKTFAVHAWGAGFQKLCEELVKARLPDGLWICFCANPQTWPAPDLADLLGKKPYSSPFAIALRCSQKVVAVRNERFNIFERLWCVFELFLAQEDAKRIDLIGMMPDKTWVSGEGIGSKAKCSSPAETVLLQDAIRRKELEIDLWISDLMRSPARTDGNVSPAPNRHPKAATQNTYTVAHDDLPVTASQRRTSVEVARLSIGTHVELLEVASELDQGRVRARIAFPAGWISTKIADGSYHFVVQATQQTPYTVVHGDLPVTASQLRNSAEVARLCSGTQVEVLEVAGELDQGRVRARIAFPAGWISTKMADDSQHFVVQASQEHRQSHEKSVKRFSRVDSVLMISGADLAGNLTHSKLKTITNVLQLKRALNLPGPLRAYKIVLGTKTVPNDFPLQYDRACNEGLALVVVKTNMVDRARTIAHQIEDALPFFVGTSYFRNTDNVHLNLISALKTFADTDGNLNADVEYKHVPMQGGLAETTTRPIRAVFQRALKPSSEVYNDLQGNLEAMQRNVPMKEGHEHMYRALQQVDQFLKDI